MADWIKGAVQHPGAFKKKAESAGKSTAAMAAAVKANPADYSPRTRKQAALAQTLSKVRSNSDKVDTAAKKARRGT